MKSIIDEVDVDDDNDGILDVDETGDSDLDGIPDSEELDADDGCSDAKEAGFTDANGDGIVDGTSIMQMVQFKVQMDINY